MNTSDIIEPEKWTCSANEVLHISIAEPSKAISFLPKFTYPIFGDSEQIFGYQDLRIDLAFDCLSMKPLLTYKYSKKLSKDIKSIEEIFENFLPRGDYILKDENEWIDCIANEKFELNDENIIYSYERKIEDKIKKFDIYKFQLNFEEIGKTLLLRIQILVLFFIEAGSYININDKGWEIYLIYDRNEIENKKIFIGFCTCYKFWKFEEFEKYDSIKDFDNEIKFRSRLSQIIILPPFQGNGHGKEIYKCITEEWIKDKRCEEITIEDPNEEFDELRDKIDLERFIESGLIKEIKEIPINFIKRKELRKKLKLTKRQFNRILEMGLYYYLLVNKNKEQGNKEEEYSIKNFQGEKSIRLMIKKRIYESNKEGLESIGDKEIVKSKLQEVYLRVARDHRTKAEEAVQARGGA